MNLINFLKEIDTLTEQYSTEQLGAFIHEMGRVFPEHGREEFLEMLKSVGNKAEMASDKKEEKDVAFDEMYSHIRDNLKMIDSQEIAITGIWNEEYDDWYDDSSEEFYYEDNSGISVLCISCSTTGQTPGGIVWNYCKCKGRCNHIRSNYAAWRRRITCV